MGGPDVRKAFVAALMGAGDDLAAPIRVVLSMRSDFLDHVGENPAFMDVLSAGLQLLPPPNREGLREAITAPVEMAGYRYEDEAVVEDMLDSLETSKGALPLLQFAAARLWDVRDRKRLLLPSARYWAMGAVGGALAKHADDVIDTMPSATQSVVRKVFARLVTPEGTRAIVELEELRGLGDFADVFQIIETLVNARLLTQTVREDGHRTVEIVHESLLSSWPRLKRWMEEDGGDAAFLHEVQAAAKHWNKNGRKPGLLWRAESARRAKEFAERFQGEVTELEDAFLSAVETERRRAARRRRRFVGGLIASLAIIASVASVGLVTVRNAERSAVEQAEIASQEATRARQAERKISAQLDEIQRAEEARSQAEDAVKASDSKLEATNQKLQSALSTAEDARTRAEAASRAAEQAKREFERLYQQEKARRQQLEKQRRKIATER